MKRFYNWLKCKVGLHEIYSIAQDNNFYQDESASFNSGKELIDEFFRVSALRCRHCDYVYKGRYEAINKRH